MWQRRLGGVIGSGCSGVRQGGGAKMVEKFVGALPGRFRALGLDKMFNFENVKKVLIWTCVDSSNGSHLFA